MTMQLVEKHIIKRNDCHYGLLDNFCFLAKNLYNHANFLVREKFIKEEKWLRYAELDKLLKADTEYPDYKAMPAAQIAQQTLRLLDKNWKSFFAAIKDWGKHKDKYLGRPKLPRYKKKDGRSLFVVTNQLAKLKQDGHIHFPKSFDGFTLKPVCIHSEGFKEINQVRFLPRSNHIAVEIVYTVETAEQLQDNGRYLSIDIGLDNLAAVTSNTGAKPIVINGRGIKSINKYYNKLVSHYREIAKRMNGKDFTKRMSRITAKRNAKISDYLHKASRLVIEYTLKNNINTIVIGYNKGWKQESKLSRNVNQSFVGLPTQKFIEMVQYKAQRLGITVILAEESYTSGTSFLDSENPTKENYDKRRRIHRGLFKSNSGVLINADINASFQILKKVFPNAFADGIEGVALHPVRVNAA